MLYNIIVLEHSMMFCVTVICDMWPMCDIILTPNSKSKNKKINRNKNKNKKRNENNSSPLSSPLSLTLTLL